ncbi:MAG: hypothetical protein HY769_05835 [Candidatus Stahlbacteria bacterium]|nr:hypothetical protein [Candidatus Stahlbacteria bacterium]
MKSPLPPSWDTTFNLPLASRKILMSDIAPGDSIAIFSYGFNIDTINMELVIDSLTEDTLLTLSDIILNLKYVDTVNYTIANLLPELIPFHSQTIDVAALTFAKSDTFVLENETWQVMVDSGYLKIGIYNGSPLRIDSVHWTCFTPDTFDFYAYNIGAGESKIYEYNLSGHAVNNIISYNIEGWTAETTSVLIDTLDTVALNCELSIQKINSLIGKFPACSTNVAVDLRLNPYKIDTAIIDTGSINVKLLNPIKCNFNLQIEGNDCSFLPFTSYIVAGLNDTTGFLNNDSIIPTNPDTIKLNLLLSTTGSAIYDTINNVDTFAINIKLQELKIARFKGFIDTTITADIPHYGQAIDYQNIDPTLLQVDSVCFYYDIYNEINANPLLNILLSGERNLVWKYINVAAQIRQGENYDTIGGDSVTEFVNAWPESIDVSGKVELSGAIDVKNEDKVFGEIGFMVPLVFTIESTLVIEPDSFIALSVPENVREATILDTPKLHIWTSNSTPIAGDIEVFLSNDTLSMINPIISMNLSTGINDYWRDMDISDLLKYEKLWARTRVRLFPGQFRIYSNQKIHIKTLLKIKTRVGT